MLEPQVQFATILITRAATLPALNSRILLVRFAIFIKPLVKRIPNIPTNQPQNIGKVPIIAIMINN